MISISVVIFTHQIICSKIRLCLTLLETYKTRVYYPKTTRFKKNVLYKGLELINSIGPKFRLLPHCNLKTGKIPINLVPSQQGDLATLHNNDTILL